MSFYYREKPRFGERFRGKSGDELLEELNKEFGDDSPFFERTNGGSPGPNNRSRDPFERHTTFPRGFPFDDDVSTGGFGRRSDIRAHLDDLAARHPEFADQLLGPPWADVPFPGANGTSSTLPRNRRNSAATKQPYQNGGNAYYNHPEEDARSQASGGSAASGASAVSSHGSEPDQELRPEDQKSGPRNHTLDIGQHQHNMENPQPQRNVRSMSAPPENRNNLPDNNQQRFVSRVDINPQAQAAQTQPQQSAQAQTQPPQQSQREKSPAPQAQKQHGNVRQIPIFVEGRDKPVIAKERDEPDFSRRQQSPPHFQRPSHFQQHYNRQPAGWGSNFQDPFFEHGGRWNQPPPQPQPTFNQFRHTQQEKPKTQQTHNPEFWQHNQQQHKPHTQPQPQKPPQNEPQPEAPPKPRQQVQPKDPLEKVAMVQKEVDALTEQVKQFTGNSRQDKQYMFLDEMLTRELIKLDDIDTEGKENVRQARKQAIKSIQESISLLESKAPVPGQQTEESEEKTDEKQEVKEEQMKVDGTEKPDEPMETSQEPAPEEQKAIPLPPPSSPSKTAEVPEVKEKIEENPSVKESTQPNESNTQTQKPNPNVPQPETPVQDTQQQQTPPTVEDIQKSQSQEQKPQNPEPMDSSSAAAPQVPTNDVEMEVRQSSPAKELPPNPEQSKESEKENVKEKKSEVKTETGKTKKEPPPVPAKPGKSPKKAKKTKKQPEPISETAIPLPAPGQSIQ